MKMKILFNVLGLITTLFTIYYLSIIWIFNNLTLKEGEQSLSTDLVLSTLVIILNFLMFIYFLYAIIKSNKKW